MKPGDLTVVNLRDPPTGLRHAHLGVIVKEVHGVAVDMRFFEVLIGDKVKLICDHYMTSMKDWETGVLTVQILT